MSITYIAFGDVVYYPYANYHSSPPNNCTEACMFSKACAYAYPSSGKIKLYGVANPQSQTCDIINMVSKASFNDNPVPGNSPVISGTGGTLKLIIHFNIEGYLNGTDPARSTEIVKITIKVWRKDNYGNWVFYGEGKMFSKIIHQGKLILSSTMLIYQYLYNVPDGTYTFTVHAYSQAFASCELGPCSFALVELYHAVRPHSERGIKIYYFGGEFI